MNREIIVMFCNWWIFTGQTIFIQLVFGKWIGITCFIFNVPTFIYAYLGILYYSNKLRAFAYKS